MRRQAGRQADRQTNRYLQADMSMYLCVCMQMTCTGMYFDSQNSSERHFSRHSNENKHFCHT